MFQLHLLVLSVCSFILFSIIKRDPSVFVEALQLYKLSTLTCSQTLQQAFCSFLIGRPGMCALPASPVTMATLNNRAFG